MRREHSAWKRVLIRFIFWLLTKFIKDPKDASMVLGANPLVGIRKHGSLLLGLVELGSVKDPFTCLRENITTFEKTVEEDDKEPTSLVQFKTIAGGKMPKKFDHHLETPLITIILVTHSGDWHLLPRAIDSILKQNMDLNLLELLIYFDGVPTEKETWEEEEAANFNSKVNFLYNCQLHHAKEKNGYYCVGRNRTTPLAQGMYIYNMDADNEIAPNHLPNLLEEIRNPDENGFPHFTYTRRKYIVDEGVEKPPTKPGAISSYVPWEPKYLARLSENPTNNFIDTGDFLISKSVLYRLSDTTGCIWNSQCRRFGDWDLVVRMMGSGFRGRVLDQATNLYHWTGGNLQMTRSLSDIVVLPESIYNEMAEKGLVVD